MNRAASGWYPDPERPATLRYWDGQQWTEHRAQAPAATWDQQQQVKQDAKTAKKAERQRQKNQRTVERERQATLARDEKARAWYRDRIQKYGGDFVGQVKIIRGNATSPKHSARKLDRYTAMGWRVVSSAPFADPKLGGLAFTMVFEGVPNHVLLADPNQPPESR